MTLILLLTHLVVNFAWEKLWVAVTPRSCSLLHSKHVKRSINFCRSVPWLLAFFSLKAYESRTQKIIVRGIFHGRVFNRLTHLKLGTSEEFTHGYVSVRGHINHIIWPPRSQQKEKFLGWSGVWAHYAMYLESLRLASYPTRLPCSNITNCFNFFKTRCKTISFFDNSSFDSCYKKIIFKFQFTKNLLHRNE